jgi:hypothetical protein
MNARESFCNSKTAFPSATLSLSSPNAFARISSSVGRRARESAFYKKIRKRAEKNCENLLASVFLWEFLVP